MYFYVRHPPRRPRRPRDRPNPPEGPQGPGLPFPFELKGLPQKRHRAECRLVDSDFVVLFRRRRLDDRVWCVKDVLGFHRDLSEMGDRFKCRLDPESGLFRRLHDSVPRVDRRPGLPAW